MILPSLIFFCSPLNLSSGCCQETQVAATGVARGLEAQLSWMLAVVFSDVIVKWRLPTMSLSNTSPLFSARLPLSIDLTNTFPSSSSSSTRPRGSFSSTIRSPAPALLAARLALAKASFYTFITRDLALDVGAAE